MNRRQFLIGSTLAAAGTVIPFKTISATNFFKTFTGIRRNVGYFTQRGGTIGWLAADDALVVVDSQFPEPARACIAGLGEKTAHPVDALINTHHHGDHTSGNTVFKGKAGTIVAHKNVPGLMRQAREEGDPEPAYPDKTFSESWKMDAGNETVHAAYYGPAHTGGDAVIYFERANVVHMGDLVFNRMNPYTDRPAGASIHNWINVLESAVGEYPQDAVYIFGHGNEKFGVTGSRKDVLLMRDYLSALVEHVEKGIESGKSKEEIIEKQQMEEFPQFMYAEWWTLSQNLEVAYAEAMDIRE